jgi:xanthine dehydrogenase YagS FAD-binding subunit
MDRWLHGGIQERLGEPSDFMAALLALNASIQLSGVTGDRTVALETLVTHSLESTKRVYSPRQDERLANIQLARQSAGEQSICLKALNSKVWAFAQVGVAVWLRMDNAVVADTRLVASGISPTLWRLSHTEQMLIGQPLEENQITRAVESVLYEVTPAQPNGFKVPLVKGLLHRALIYLAQEK